MSPPLLVTAMAMRHAPAPRKNAVNNATKQRSASFQAQAAHFRFSPDTRRIAASRHLATNQLTKVEAGEFTSAKLLRRKEQRT